MSDENERRFASLEQSRTKMESQMAEMQVQIAINKLSSDRVNKVGALVIGTVVAAVLALVLK